MNTSPNTVSNIVMLSPERVWLSLSDKQPFQDLQQTFNLTNFMGLLNADTLNRLKTALAVDLPYHFVCQKQLQNEADYYETIIFEQHIIPTRPDCWHDLYNGLIWLLFPKTKRLLNQWHVSDIATFGLHPRNMRRNKITHFDECGVIIICDEKAFLHSLQEHEFKQVFYTERNRWNKDVHAISFGHANYEMLMQPFIGLTGKWLSVSACPNFADLSFFAKCEFVDMAVSEQLMQENNFTGKNLLSPIPLLGIPSWHAENRNASFYDNLDYFRPKSTKKMLQRKGIVEV